MDWTEARRRNPKCGQEMNGERQFTVRHTLGSRTAKGKASDISYVTSIYLHTIITFSLTTSFLLLNASTPQHIHLKNCFKPHLAN